MSRIVSLWAKTYNKVAERLPKSFGFRVIMLSLGLLLVIQAASFLTIRSTIDQNARASTAADLEVGERVLQRLLDQNAQKLIEVSSLLAADDKFRAAINRNDDDTINSMLSLYGERIGATVTALLDTRYQVQAPAEANHAGLEPIIHKLTAQIASHTAITRRATAIVTIGKRPFQVVMVPVRAAAGANWVLLGLPIDQRLMDDMHNLSSLEVSLQVRKDSQSPWQIATSSLSPQLHELIDRQHALGSAARNTEHSSAISLTLPDGEYSGRMVNLTEHDKAGVSALLMSSVDAAAAPYRQLQFGLTVLTLLGMVAFAMGSTIIARHVTAPVHNLNAAAQRIVAGDYVTPLQSPSRSDELDQLALSFEQMRTSIANQHDEILKVAYWDKLTSLPSRAQFRNAVIAAVEAAQTTRRSVAVVMLDLDRFQHVNDMLGYRIGDLLLKSVAERLSQQAVRTGDLLARLGSDEFAVLLSDLEPASDIALTRSVSQRIVQAFSTGLILEGQPITVSVSIGMALWPHHASDIDMLTSRAEVAMYTAKKLRSEPLFYDHAVDAANLQAMSLLTELREAMDRQEFCLYLQPKLEMSTAQITGAEALLRWQHPQRGLLLPEQFIPLAEQTGFIRQLTMWTFGETARIWKMLNENGVRLTIAVNLSTADLIDPELAQKLDATVREHEVPAEAFCLEITEGSLAIDPQRALVTLERLSALGFHLSIDNFGTGYSSLTYLKRLPLDELKIDESFTLNMENELADARVVRAIIDLAHGLGLRVVADAVESAKTWDLLRELSCNEAQGFHMGRPMPSSEFALWSTGWAAQHMAPGPKVPGSDTSILLH